jgi:hypothetical protein
MSANKHRVLYLLMMVLSLVPSLLFAQAQGTQTDFGKNRIQYKDFTSFRYLLL